jgi:hypothetical protein
MLLNTFLIVGKLWTRRDAWALIVGKLWTRRDAWALIVGKLWTRERVHRLDSLTFGLVVQKFLNIE